MWTKNLTSFPLLIYYSPNSGLPFSVFSRCCGIVFRIVRAQSTRMTKLYRQFYLQIVASVILFFGIHPSINAQETVQGVVRLKVSESLAATLERQALARSPGGEVLTGVASLDQLNKQFNIRRFSRVFPHAGKHEARHRKHGLHLWYEAALDRSSPVSTVMQSYQSEAQILRVEPVYKKALIGSASTRFPSRCVH